ncbi:MAG: hypothetical protein ACYC61_25200, partial [Isosphaeraceae bacterium]
SRRGTACIGRPDMRVVYLNPVGEVGGAELSLLDLMASVAIRESVASKWEGHEINTARFIQPERLMHSIGG